MFENFRTYILEKTDLTREELGLIEAACVVKKLRKNQYLLQEGDIYRYNTFVVKGCLRLYRLGDDGKEHILRFAVENWWISDRESYVNETPSKSYIDALENSIVLNWNKGNWNSLKQQIPNFVTFEENLKARNSNATLNRIHANIGFSAEQKYNDFVINFPDFYNRVPLSMVASFLGISRETLSRIRNQKANPNK